MVKKETKTEIRVVNIVVSAALEHDIPLEKMAATLPNTEYNPEQFPGLVLRIKNQKTTSLIFNSGKIVCTGAKTLDIVTKSIQEIIKTLKKIDINIEKEPEFTVQNIVASGNIFRDLNLNTLAIKLQNTEYEPEQFPGLVYKLMINPKSAKPYKATFLLFPNGKIVCTGTKSEAQVNESVIALIESLDAVDKK